MIFQDPYASLNPRMKVEEVIAEPLRAHGVGSRAERSARVRELLELVGLPEVAARRFPHAFSGGQRQRIGIARALALRPELVVADEPVSALDVSIQAQIVNLLKDLQDELGLTLLFIAHDLAVVRQTREPGRGDVPRARSSSSAPRDAIFEDPRHPYTQSLLSAVPVPDPRARARARAHRAHRRRAEPDHASLRLPLPHALPVRDARIAARSSRSCRRRATARVVACHLVHPPEVLDA